jgi:hypothetical protein
VIAGHLFGGVVKPFKGRVLLIHPADEVNNLTLIIHAHAPFIAGYSNKTFVEFVDNRDRS